MCGMFGFYRLSQGIVNPTVLTRMANANEARGRVGYGYWAHGPDGDEMRRSMKLISMYLVQGMGIYRAAAFHLRAPTGGQGGGPETLHPFVTDRFVLAHNGVLVDWQRKEMYQRWRHNASSGHLANVNVDSTVILAGIQSYMETEAFNVASAIATVMERVEGQAACWLWDRYDNCFYLWRVMSTLYYWDAERVIYFSSVPVDNYAAAELAQGIVYRLDDNGLQPSLTFQFATPYGL